MLKCVFKHIPKNKELVLKNLVRELIHCKKENISIIVEKIKNTHEPFYKYLNDNWMGEEQRW